MFRFLAKPLVIIFALFTPGFAFAAPKIQDARTFLDQTHAPTGLAPTKNAVDIAVQVIQVGFGLVGLIFLCLMIYAGFMWMLDRGNEERAATARSTFTAATAGLIVILAAYAIATFVTNFISG